MKMTKFWILSSQRCCSWLHARQGMRIQKRRKMRDQLKAIWNFTHPNRIQMPQNL